MTNSTIKCLSRYGVLALAGVVVAGPAWGQDDAFAFPPARVEVALAEMREMAPSVDVSGTVVSLNDSRIASEIEGVLTWLADVGDAVDAGDVIARIDPQFIRIEVTRAQAEVARLRSDFEYRELQLERTEELATKNSVSKTLLDEARAQREQAQHSLTDAEAALERARANLQRTQIRAAFAGHVVARLASVGEFVNVGEDVIRLVDTHRIEISLPASLALTAYIEPGMDLAVRNNGVERVHPVRTVVPVGDAVSRMVEVRLSAGDGGWLVGTPVKVSLPSDTPAATVAVPRDALVERSGQSFVYKVTEDGTAEQVTVSIRSIVGLWVGIADGVAPGDRVIVRGAERLAPGQAVEVIETVSTP
ncbi:MAG: efflux RND transporter periplasmic adaptor subunit [Chromatiales bacterium]|nr:MAG: efflux RND transporter periplasmic adaptor subunit [Chromatiales bacterium]